MMQGVLKSIDVLSLGCLVFEGLFERILLGFRRGNALNIKIIDRRLTALERSMLRHLFLANL